MEGQWMWQQVCSKAVGIVVVVMVIVIVVVVVVVVVVVAAMGCVVVLVFRIIKLLNKQVYNKKDIPC
jgi:hypothetical protein